MRNLDKAAPVGAVARLPEGTGEQAGPGTRVLANEPTGLTPAGADAKLPEAGGAKQATDPVSGEKPKPPTPSTINR